MNNFDDAARLLAQPLGDLLLALPEQTKEEITELRVRRGRHVGQSDLLSYRWR